MRLVEMYIFISRTNLFCKLVQEMKKKERKKPKQLRRTDADISKCLQTKNKRVKDTKNKANPKRAVVKNWG